LPLRLSAWQPLPLIFDRPQEIVVEVLSPDRFLISGEEREHSQTDTFSALGTPAPYFVAKPSRLDELVDLIQESVE